MKVLLIHGPNMNLLGLYSKHRLTLDKLNRAIKNHIKTIPNLEVKIAQTHDETKFVSLLQKNRNKVDAFILNIGAWHISSYLIKDTLNILKLPYRIVEGEKSEDFLAQSIFNTSN